MNKKLLSLFWLLCPLFFVGQLSAKDITVYVRVDGATTAPNIWYWGAVSPQGGWPGEAMSGPVQKTPTAGGDSKSYYYYTFSGLADNASMNVIFSLNGSPQTTNIEGLIVDHYYHWTGDAYSGLTDETEEFGELPDATISSVEFKGFGDWNNGKAFTKTDGSEEYKYTLDLSDVTTDQEFKLVVNGTIWLGSNDTEKLTLTGQTGFINTDGDNLKLLNSTSGYKTYNFTATWAGGKDASTGWTLDIQGGEPRTEPIQHTYTVVGGSAELFGETWNPKYTANDMTLSSDDQTYTWTKEGVELEAGTIEYKVAQDHDWSVSYPNSGNSTKAIDQAGIYNVTITLNPSTDTEPTMTATLVGKVITIGEYGYATYCGNLDLDFSNTTGLQAFAVTDVADGVMMLTEYDGGVKAGEAAILKGDEGTYQVPVAASEPASIDGNMLIGNSTSAAIEVTADNTTYRFGYSPLAGKVGFMKATSNFTVGAGKAYLKVGMAAAPEFIGFDGTATGIDTANVSTEDVKGERYNLNGQRVNASYRGVVIMSGKKYIQK